MRVRKTERERERERERDSDDVLRNNNINGKWEINTSGDLK